MDGHIQELTEWIKMRLYEKSRSLSLALGILDVREDERTGTMGADGRTLYVNGAWLAQAFLADSEGLCLLFLHVLCHCMLRHPFRWREYERRQGTKPERLDCGAEPFGSPEAAEAKAGSVKAEKSLLADWEREAWELADAILGQPGKSCRDCCRFAGADDHEIWRERRAAAGEQAKAGGPGAGSGLFGEEAAERKKDAAAGGRSPKTLDGAELRRCWERAWQQARRFAGGEKRAGSRRLSVAQSLTLTDQKRYDYREYLRSFSGLREEGGLDPEQFDYGLYFWGLREYKNMPLIEPPEYRERRKIEELVIVIDTSGSCSRELVRMFLEETRNILKEEELFFRRFLLHIIQCDNQVQRDDRITCQEELDSYLEKLQVKGGGGTDFRPAFERIEELRQKELYRLKGILYFTDGYGVYPAKMPDYRVDFVFLKYRYDDIDVPEWAGKLVLDAERPKGAEYEH